MGRCAKAAVQRQPWTTATFACLFPPLLRRQIQAHDGSVAAMVEETLRRIYHEDLSAVRGVCTLHCWCLALHC